MACEEEFFSIEDLSEQQADSLRLVLKIVEKKRGQSRQSHWIAFDDLLRNKLSFFNFVRYSIPAYDFCIGTFWDNFLSLSKKEKNALKGVAFLIGELFSIINFDEQDLDLESYDRREKYGTGLIKQVKILEETIIKQSLLPNDHLEQLMESILKNELTERILHRDLFPSVEFLIMEELNEMVYALETYMHFLASRMRMRCYPY